LWHLSQDFWNWFNHFQKLLGQNVVLNCKWMITDFYTQYRPPLPLPPPQSMLLQPKHIKPDEKWGTTLNRGRGGLTFCWNSKVLWYLSEDVWNWL
jgi:hypothetical protein